MPMLFLRAEKKYFSRAKILKILNDDDDDVRIGWVSYVRLN